MATDEIKWETPGPNQRGGNSVRSEFYKQLAAALRERPGEWAVMGENLNASAATAARRGSYPAFTPPTEWEFAGRHKPEHEPSRATIYVRYIGNNAT